MQDNKMLIFVQIHPVDATLGQNLIISQMKTGEP